MVKVTKFGVQVCHAVGNLKIHFLSTEKVKQAAVKQTHGHGCLNKDFRRKQAAPGTCPAGCSSLTPDEADYSRRLPANHRLGHPPPHHEVLWRKPPASASGPEEGPARSVHTLTLTHTHTHMHLASGVFFPLSPSRFSIFSSFVGESAGTGPNSPLGPWHCLNSASCPWETMLVCMALSLAGNHASDMGAVFTPCLLAGSYK